MDSSRPVLRVSLRGASAKEESRDALLEKSANERASRSAARRMARAALSIQRIWRGRSVAALARNRVESAWDSQMLLLQSVSEAEQFARDILRPFVFFTRHLAVEQSRLLHEKQLERVFICFQTLLQSLSCTDSRNYFRLAVGTEEQRTVWSFQVHRLLNLCSVVLMERCHSDAVSNSLLALVMRLMVTLTDTKVTEVSVSGSRKQEAGAVVSRLLLWLAGGSSRFYYAAHQYLLQAYPLGGKSSLGKDNFVVVASVITMALRPLHVVLEENLRYEQDEGSQEKAASQICREILTVPCLIDRLPAGIVPAFQHPHILAPCLQVCKVALFDQSDVKDEKLPVQAWTLANFISLASGIAKGAMFEDFVEAVRCLLQSLLPWVDTVRDRKSCMQDEDDRLPVLAENDLAHATFIRLLSPLHQQAQLLEKVTASGLPEAARLYSYLLTVFSALNDRGGALPVLNVLAFTKELLPQLWNWLCGCLNVEVVSAVRAGTPSAKEERSGRQLSSKWPNSFLKKVKNARPDTGVETADQSIYAPWHINQLKEGPSQVPEVAVPVLTLFCTTYAHLLLILDDDEFYSKQVPFTLEDQRIICAVLNSLVYHGLLSSSKHHFSTLMEASSRCLRALYERDSHRGFCPAELWLAPAVERRPAIAAAARAHEMATVSKAGETSQAPALGSILTTVPHVLPFEERVQIFREFVKNDKSLRKISIPASGCIEISVRRDHVVEDGLQQLNGLGSRLKGYINVSFVNEHGLAEAGLDYGGLFKEFLTDLAKAVCDPGYGLFLQTATEERLLFPHPAASSLPQGLRTIEFLGRIVGKALYEGILLEHAFSPVFVSKILGRYNPIDDLASLDSELHRNLMYLKNYDGDVSDLALDFTVTEELFGKRTIIELIPGGAKVSVNNANKLQYVHAMADYKLTRQVRPVVSAFIRGLTDLIAPSWLGLFNAKEFNQLLSGEEHDFDVHDLKANTRYTGGYTETSRTIKLFWEVLEGLDAKDRCAVLKFVTSCSRAPLLGFKHLQPPFTIHRVVYDTNVWTFLGAQDVDRLPTASTCYNILKLPTYRRSSTLREKLQYAIRSNSGFELS